VEWRIKRESKCRKQKEEKEKIFERQERVKKLLNV
jgi:hypothetical protein